MRKDRNNFDRLHKPVMVHEVVDFLVNKSSNSEDKYIDATLGAAGHSLALANYEGKVLGIDQDKRMLEIARKNIACPSPQLRGSAKLVHGNFRDIDRIAGENGFARVRGIVFDLGISSFHYQSGQGFSFQEGNNPLDMRLDPESQSVRGSDLLNSLRTDQLETMFEEALTKGESKRLVKKIIRFRERTPIKTVNDFLSVIRQGVIKKGKTDPATRPFLALRMAVNSEVDSLQTALPKAEGLLISGGRLAIISFHSGEDRIVKEYFKERVRGGYGRLVTAKPVLPSIEEVKENPSSRSAKLRIYEKI
ncbi:MAG: Ribosomal RNA small subunit methyltransferase H [Candidatus Woesebacteria bacterium GW2011_GWB1_43_14]|uniref:Ribosomal RNA small subunit methyltransferase H n=1 Tax=Candidatus Woesebacteria bacterium GW2011_GWB1_43_14 TaxID=1618578 RepID=A0A0G1DHX2_9BACT|nr:MAG: Ribosomal RNA small subunit methyltransferase H [Candidatus Woesebacteria bacterium GW2011_GWA1_39_11b]KKS78426.1 MAG: Ribosomal RNA small subunit methyltransferase H [Candidatus Woesebacteria bacterium GW2011_GWC1_42_9]KKS97157.1 MAG: Ribosomal RNA small subunit methyltransferase H [Candidatus Woesebacteria bacterium GW2011_GWB1_43_14]